MLFETSYFPFSRIENGKQFFILKNKNLFLKIVAT